MIRVLTAASALICMVSLPSPLPPPPLFLSELLQLAPSLLGVPPPLLRDVPHLLGARLHRGQRVIGVEPRRLSPPPLGVVPAPYVRGRRLHALLGIPVLRRGTRNGNEGGRGDCRSDAPAFRIGIPRVIRKIALEGTHRIPVSHAARLALRLSGVLGRRPY